MALAGLVTQTTRSSAQITVHPLTARFYASGRKPQVYIPRLPNIRAHRQGVKDLGRFCQVVDQHSLHMTHLQYFPQITKPPNRKTRAAMPVPAFVSERGENKKCPQNTFEDFHCKHSSTEPIMWAITHGKESILTFYTCQSKLEKRPWSCFVVPFLSTPIPKPKYWSFVCTLTIIHPITPQKLSNIPPPNCTVFAIPTNSLLCVVA